MIVRHFLAWIETAPAPARADATSALARALLYSPLGPSERREAEAALTLLLDDPSPLVRTALAEALASAVAAPRHLVLALAGDRPDIAAIVLRRSPLLAEAELVDAAALGCAMVQTAIARRPDLSAPVAAAVAEIGEVEALVALAGNPGADLPGFAMARMVERAGDEPGLREALLARPDLPVAVRQQIVVALSDALARLVRERNWLQPERGERVVREATIRATLRLAEAASDAEALALAAHLRRTGQLNAMLCLRTLLDGETRLFAAALAELSGLPLPRVASLSRDPRGVGFAALLRRAGLPEALRPVFRAALEALHETAHEADRADASLAIVARVLDAAAALDPQTRAPLLAMLRRVEAEIARDAARALTATLAEPAPPLLLSPPAPANEAHWAAEAA